MTNATGCIFLWVGVSYDHASCHKALK